MPNFASIFSLAKPYSYCEFWQLKSENKDGRPSMQECKYASMHIYASMQVCNYAQVCKYASMHVYASIQVCRYAYMQVCMYMQVCKYASMQLCNYAIMQVCKYASMLIYTTVFRKFPALL